MSEPRDRRDEARAAELEEELQQQSEQAEAEQLEREISGDLTQISGDPTPEDVEIIRRREERYEREAAERQDE